MKRKQFVREESSLEDLDELILKGQEYLEELKEILSDIKVPVRSDNQVVLDSVRQLFGDQYINSKGQAFITFDMYLDCLTLMRNVGRSTAAEFAV